MQRMFRYIRFFDSDTIFCNFATTVHFESNSQYVAEVQGYSLNSRDLTEVLH